LPQASPRKVLRRSAGPDVRLIDGTELQTLTTLDVHSEKPPGGLCFRISGEVVSADDAMRLVTVGKGKGKSSGASSEPDRQVFSIVLWRS
jgi:hypothetical protein